ncbi:hypothetical protein HNR60_003916 [Rhodopseudomonas rhenobacensis]|uniref:Uncharacterized protein n=1 Tax=Rhodopseudomonas rhenobacensis TaxID=87461 RepID=A0A7W8E0P8_9BRAD|nr:hypothetical protein [Rhodopseudomonas rhenobacensis]MBB5049142.1 hypothetical protein [Rhodopseudomonas rhenobacensis]
MITAADFQDLLDRLGEDLESWPVPQRQAAAELLRQSGEARAMLDQAGLLRRALASEPVRAGAALTERIMRGIQPDPAPAAEPPQSLRSRV